MMRLMDMKVSIIGVGRVGGAIALILNEKGVSVENLFTHHPRNARQIADETKAKILDFSEFSSIESDVVFITTHDYEIENTAENLAENLRTKPTVFHTSGALSSEVLNKLKSIGCLTGSIHPLVSISDAKLGKERFKQAYFCLEGDPQAVKTAEKIVHKLEGKSFSVKTEFKTLYHAAAVTACGHLVALIDTAIEMLTRCGLQSGEAQKVLLPLIESTVENLKAQNPAAALTGTFARGDVETFRRHLETLRKNVSGDVLQTYLQLGERSAHLAQQHKAEGGDFDKMLQEILLAKSELK